MLEKEPSSDERQLVTERTIADLDRRFATHNRWTSVRRAATTAPPAISKLLSWGLKLTTGSDIPTSVEFPKGVIVMHRGIGLVMHPDSQIAPPSIVFHGVTIGNRWSEIDGVPSIGPFTFIGAGAILLGDITIGACSVVAAGAVVTRSVPPLSIVSGNPGVASPGDRANLRRWFRVSDTEIDAILGGP